MVSKLQQSLISLSFRVKWFSSVIVITSNMPRSSYNLANYLTVGRLVKAWLNALSSTCRPLDLELQDWHWALDDVDDVDYNHTFNF